MMLADFTTLGKVNVLVVIIGRRIADLKSEHLHSKLNLGRMACIPADFRQIVSQADHSSVEKSFFSMPLIGSKVVKCLQIEAKICSCHLILE